MKRRGRVGEEGRERGRGGGKVINSFNFIESMLTYWIVFQNSFECDKR